MPNFEFYDDNEQALQHPCVILRDSLGALAVQMLASKDGFASMSNETMLRELHDIICSLQKTYEHDYVNFND